jgi:hypothetical protein
MLKTESGNYTEFAGAQVSEVKVNSNVESAWFRLTGGCNPADLGTRTAATPQDIIAGSEYQEGMGRMKRPKVE